MSDEFQSVKENYAGLKIFTRKQHSSALNLTILSISRIGVGRHQLGILWKRTVIMVKAFICMIQVNIGSRWNL